MKLRRLNSGITGVILFLTGLLFASSCNNSDKSGKTSTSETDTSATVNTKMNDTSTTNPPAKTTTTTAKKIGKVSLATAPVNKETKMQADNMGYYNYTETTPMYPGGQGSLETYVNNNIEYPQEAIDNGVEGTVNVIFTIDENGKVANAKTTGAKLGYGLEEAAIKVVNNMPKWTPGMVKGKSVKAWYTLPLTFRLEG